MSIIVSGVEVSGKTLYTNEDIEGLCIDKVTRSFYRINGMYNRWKWRKYSAMRMMKKV